MEALNTHTDKQRLKCFSNQLFYDQNTSLIVLSGSYTVDKDDWLFYLGLQLS